MKLIPSLLLSLGLVFALPAHAAKFSCNQGLSGAGHDVGVIVDSISLHCTHGETVDILGAGLSAHGALVTDLWMECSGEDARGKYYGVNIGGAVYAGVDAGVFVGRPGVCALHGVNLASLGIDLSAVRLEIR